MTDFEIANTCLDCGFGEALSNADKTPARCVECIENPNNHGNWVPEGGLGIRDEKAGVRC